MVANGDLQVRVAVLEDRMERSHRDHRRLEDSIKDMYAAIHAHMEKEDEDRKALMTTLYGIRNALNDRIELLNNKHIEKKYFVTGIVASVSVFWVVGIVIARAAGVL